MISPPFSWMRSPTTSSLTLVSCHSPLRRHMALGAESSYSAARSNSEKLPIDNIGRYPPTRQVQSTPWEREGGGGAPHQFQVFSPRSLEYSGDVYAGRGGGPPSKLYKHLQCLPTRAVHHFLQIQGNSTQGADTRVGDTGKHRVGDKGKPNPGQTPGWEIQVKKGRRYRYTHSRGRH